MSLSVTTAAALLLALALHELFRRRNAALKPPGPPGYSIIGNLLDIPAEYEWKTFSEWSATYGDLISLTIPGNTLIIINSYAKAVEMLDRKGPLYSNRPFAAMAGALMGFDRSTGLLQYTPEWKTSRRWFSNEIGTTSRITAFDGQLENQGLVFINAIKADPDALYDHVYRHAGAIILRIAYGYQLTGTNDPILRSANNTMESLSKCQNPGSFWCNQLPILLRVPEWMPGAGFKRLGKAWRKEFDDATMIPLEWARSQIAQGKAEESFVSKALAAGVREEDEENFAFTASAMFLAGSDTTAISVYTLFVILARHPDVQAKAKAEVDSIVGRDRMPEVKDTTAVQMPYLDALVKELLRFHPAVPMGIPHSTSVDDMHDDYFIPKGATILTNLWGMCFDPSTYKNPEQFNPERFLGENPELDPQRIVFGFGRRICPGNVLALASVRITAAMILNSFDVLPSIGADGKIVVPEVKACAGGVSHVERVKLRVVSRK